jgi:hypothetical protein
MGFLKTGGLPNIYGGGDILLFCGMMPILSSPYGYCANNRQILTGVYKSCAAQHSRIRLAPSPTPCHAHHAAGQQNRGVYANPAAEQFFDTGCFMLRKQTLAD